MDLEQLFSNITMSDEEENDSNSELLGNFKSFDTIEKVLEHQMQNRAALVTELEAIELNIESNVAEEIQKTEKRGKKMGKRLSGENEELQRLKELCSAMENVHLTLQNSENLAKINIQDLEAKLQQTIKETTNTKIELDDIVKKYTNVYDQRNENKENLGCRNNVSLNETKNDVLKAESEYKKALQRASENSSIELEQPEDYKKYIIEIARVYVDLIKNKNNANVDGYIDGNQFSTMENELITESNELSPGLHSGSPNTQSLTQRTVLARELDNMQLGLQSNDSSPQALTQGTQLAEEFNDLQLSLQSNTANTQLLTQGTQTGRGIDDPQHNFQLNTTNTQLLIQGMVESEMNSHESTIKNVEIVQVPVKDNFNFPSPIEYQQNRQCFDANVSTDKPNCNQEEPNFSFNFNQCFDVNASMGKPTSDNQEESNFLLNFNQCFDVNASMAKPTPNNQEESNFSFNFNPRLDINNASNEDKSISNQEQSNFHFNF